MVTKFLGLIQKEIRGLHEAAYLLGSFALLSQVLALVRDRLLAGLFGAGVELDVYYAAFRVPDILYAALVSFVSVYVLIPFLAERQKESSLRVRHFLDSVFSVFGFSIIAAAALAALFAPILLSTLFPTLAASAYGDELVMLTRIILIQPIFLGLSSLLGSITQTAGRFILYAIGPVLYNLGIIFGIIVLYPVLGLSGLAWGVVIGAFLHLAVQAPYVRASGLLPRVTRAIDLSAVRRVVLFSLPRTLALSANHITLLVLFVIASKMTEGSITVLQFSYNLHGVPLAIIGVSYSVAAFPTLARLFEDGARSAFTGQVLGAARHILFWSLPAIAFFAVLRAQIVRVILGSGAFDWPATRLVAASLALLIAALAAQSLSLLLVRGYYAAGNTKTPLLVQSAGALLAVFLSLVFLALFNAFPFFQLFFETLLRVEGIAGTEVLMLPLGYALSLIAVALSLLFLFKRHFSVALAPLRRVLLDAAAAAVALGVAARAALDVLDDVFDINTFFGIFSQGFIAGLIGIAAGVLVLRLLKNRELAESSRAFHKKFWRTKTVASEQTEL